MKKLLSLGAIALLLGFAFVSPSYADYPDDICVIRDQEPEDYCYREDDGFFGNIAAENDDGFFAWLVNVL
ncbi:MAG TPA: hypothetical protein VFP95_03175 [Gammaproteobacteria bacterium]|nr:hypothetical protein [Gammaproteobacteria bacterium]